MENILLLLAFHFTSQESLEKIFVQVARRNLVPINLDKNGTIQQAWQMQGGRIVLLAHNTWGPSGVYTNKIPTCTVEVPLVPISNLSTLVVKFGTISDSIQAQ